MTRTYTTVPDKASGDIFTEAMWDTHIRDNLNNLISPPACTVTHSVASAITNAAFQTFPWNSAELDTDDMFDSAQNDRIWIRTLGLYLVTGTAKFAANATGARHVAIYPVAAVFIAAKGSHAPNNGSYDCDLSLDGMASFTAFPAWTSLQAYQSSGGNLNLNTARFSAIRVGATT